jgi:hypothetical protein
MPSIEFISPWYPFQIQLLQCSSHYSQVGYDYLPDEKCVCPLTWHPMVLASTRILADTRWRIFSLARETKSATFTTLATDGITTLR